MKMKATFVTLLALTFAQISCSKLNFLEKSEASSSGRDGLIKLSFLLTNDIHGHLENLGHLGAITRQLKAQPEYQNQSAALFVLDSGDQFQGTLVSNYDEGSTLFAALNEIGYDAVIPGNHAYDFGPIGWLYDRVTLGKTSDDPREVIKKLSKIAKFPLLSANTYLKASLAAPHSPQGLELDAECKSKNQTLLEPIDFTKGAHPEFLQSFLILQKAGVRVALIGLDNHATASVTTAENVSDLCFRDELSSYLELRKQLEGQADVFIILLHDGDAGAGQTEASTLAAKINAAYPDGVQLIAAGHTHYTHDTVSGGVHVMQDGANAKFFGRADLYFDPKSKKIRAEETETAAGIDMKSPQCGSTQSAFVCKQLPLSLPTLPSIDQIENAANAKIAPIAKQKLAEADATINIDRINESALGDFMTDTLRQATGTQVAIMNNGGLRTSLKPGDVLYENLFEVSPFQNQAVIYQAFPWIKLKGILESAIRTCGKYGSLSFSGLKIIYHRDCQQNTTIAQNSQLLHVENLNGEVLYDLTSGVQAPEDQTFTLTTLDYLATGLAEGYQDFAGTKVDSIAGIARELVVAELVKTVPTLTNDIDGRFKNEKPGSLTRAFRFFNW